MMLPWQIKQWQQLWSANREQRLPHALLLSGSSGLGKREFAESFAQSLLCGAVSDEGYHCGVCQDCRLAAASAHSSLLRVLPEEDSRVIKIDQIREINEFVSQTALRGQYRIVIIDPADSMNVNAANALLKTLEEPSPNTLLILISDQSGRMPATILSRCQRIVFSNPPREAVLAWLSDKLGEKSGDAALLLSIANGAPLKALSLLNDKLAVRQSLFDTLYLLGKGQGNPVKLAAALPDADIVELFDYMLSWLVDLLRLAWEGEVINQDYHAQLVEISGRRPPVVYARMLDKFTRMRALLCRGVSLNKQMVIEEAFVYWSGLREAA